jgi:hypothetical protein
MKKVLIFAACAEVITGLPLLIVPSLVGRLLLGEELTRIAIPVARVAGIALIGLGIACWPGPPLVGMLTYSAVVTLYLAYIGFSSPRGRGPIFFQAVCCPVRRSLHRRCRRARADLCRGAGCPCAGRDHGEYCRCRLRAAATEQDDSDRVCASPRPGQQRLRRESRPAGRQHHRIFADRTASHATNSRRFMGPAAFVSATIGLLDNPQHRNGSLRNSAGLTSAQGLFLEPPCPVYLQKRPN